MDGPADDPDAALLLISSWKTSKGIPRVLDENNSFVEPLLPLL